MKTSKILCTHQYVPLTIENKTLFKKKKPFNKERKVMVVTSVICIKCLKIETLDKSLNDFEIK